MRRQTGSRRDSSIALARLFVLLEVLGSRKTPAEMARKSRTPTASTSRGKLVSLRVTDGFRAFVLGQLAGVESVRPHPMFGGIGLYANDVFFGIVAADVLYLKVDDSNRAQYEAEGMTAFQPYADKPMTMSYYQVPARILEDGELLAAWARASIRLAARAGPRNARR